MNLTLNDFLIVQAECCRTWPVPLGVQMGTCGTCETLPVVTHPVIIIRAPTLKPGTLGR
jgi:hypothetical protein